MKFSTSHVYDLDSHSIIGSIGSWVFGYTIPVGQKKYPDGTVSYAASSVTGPVIEDTVTLTDGTNTIEVSFIAASPKMKNKTMLILSRRKVHS